MLGETNRILFSVKFEFFPCMVTNPLIIRIKTVEISVLSESLFSKCNWHDSEKRKFYRNLYKNKNRDKIPRDFSLLDEDQNVLKYTRANLSITQAHKKNFFSEPRILVWYSYVFFPAENEFATRWTPTRQDFDITSKNTKKFTGSNKIIYFMLFSSPFLRISNFVAP